MATTRRPGLSQGNVTDIADARRQSRLSKSRLSKQSKRNSASAKLLHTPAEAPTTQPAKQTKPESNRRFDHEKVESIKAAIASGTYTIDAQRIADKFIEKESP